MERQTESSMMPSSLAFKGLMLETSCEPAFPSWAQTDWSHLAGSYVSYFVQKMHRWQSISSKSKERKRPSQVALGMGTKGEGGFSQIRR